MTNRRKVLRAILAMSAWPELGVAQTRKPLVAMLLTAGPTSTGTNIWPAPFRQALAELGWIEGHNVQFVMRFANDALQRMPELAIELVALGPDVILTHTTTGAQAAAAATQTIPVIVGAAVEGPFMQIVGSLARPKGNVTGFTTASLEQHAKVIEMLRQINPSTTRIAILVNPFSIAYKDLREITTLPDFGNITFDRIEAKDDDALEPAFAQMAASRADAVVVTADPTFNRPAMDRRINQLARSAGIAVVGTFPGLMREGGLLTYGVDYQVLIKRSAAYVDKILRGAKPGDLPVERPTVFELVVNLKTAAALGLTIPPSILIRANEIIE